MALALALWLNKTTSSWKKNPAGFKPCLRREINCAARVADHRPNRQTGRRQAAFRVLSNLAWRGTKLGKPPVCRPGNAICGQTRRHRQTLAAPTRVAWVKPSTENISCKPARSRISRSRACAPRSRSPGSRPTSEASTCRTKARCTGYGWGRTNRRSETASGRAVSKRVPPPSSTTRIR